jgi:F-type H+-transporting ATPase subunit a
MVAELPVTRVVNHFLAGPANAVLNAFGVRPANPEFPIPADIAIQMLILALLVAIFLVVRFRLSVENPKPLQHVAELLRSFIHNQSEEIIGHHVEPFVPFLLVLFLYVLLNSLIGLVPGFESPTAVVTVPLGLAVVAFFYYHAHGIRKQGPLRYVAHFAGPMPVLAPLMVPIELVSHCARVLSLTVRLFANMFAGDLVTLVFFSLVPIGIPVAFLGLHIFVSLLQAYIFVLLTMVYLAGAVAEEH